MNIKTTTLTIACCLLSIEMLDAQSSNRTEIRSGLSKDWNVIWGKNFVEADWVKGSGAIASSVVTENPAPFLAWFDSVLTENFEKIQRNFKKVGRKTIEGWVLQSLKSKKIIVYENFKIQAGVATYKRWKRVVYSEPRTRKNKFGLPEPYFEKVEKKISLPNHHQFYIRYQFSSKNNGSSNGNVTKKSYTIELGSGYSEYKTYKIDGKEFRVNKGRKRVHNRTANSLTISYDSKLGSGKKFVSKSLSPGRYEFRRKGDQAYLVKLK